VIHWPGFQVPCCTAIESDLAKVDGKMQVVLPDLEDEYIFIFFSFSLVKPDILYGVFRYWGSESQNLSGK
jgi:hypothetical protein